MARFRTLAVLPLVMTGCCSLQSLSERLLYPVTSRLDVVNEQLAQTNHRLDLVNSKLDQTNKKLDQVAG
jgi:hypothetical protein